MSIPFDKRAIANRTASPIIEQPTRSDGVFSHLSNCSGKAGSCLARYTRLAVSDAEEQVRALAGRRLRSQDW
ncbi:hypothetical protein QUA00_33220 [Microcoleus sp. T2B6]|uniref:hypothetical protein n=1 Tax=Microcoleus sp. T2B6 TaxID=3055424 RepID=UPI002FD52218